MYRFRQLCVCVTLLFLLLSSVRSQQPAATGANENGGTQGTGGDSQGTGRTQGTGGETQGTGEAGTGGGDAGSQPRSQENERLGSDQPRNEASLEGSPTNDTVINDENHSDNVTDDDEDDFDTEFNCRLSANDSHIETDVLFKIDKEKLPLIQYELLFDTKHYNYTKNPLLENMVVTFNANKWSRVTSGHGQTLLSLAFNYGVLSIKTLTFGTETLQVFLIDDPPGCIGRGTERQKVAAVRYLLARDFGKTVSLKEDHRVCHEVIADVGGYADFRDRCYVKDPVTKKVKESSDDESNFWLNLLYGILIAVKFILLFFGPLLFISAVESMSHEKIPYVVKLKDTLIKTILVAPKGTQLANNMAYKQVVDLRSKRGFLKLKEVASDVVPGKPTTVKFSQYDITVNYNRMLTENIVEVGLLATLFRSVFRCKIRHVGPFRDCCKSNMLVGCPGKKRIPWIKAFKKLSSVMLILLIPFPYYIRLLIFYAWEYEDVMKRKEAVALNGLREKFDSSIVHYFTPTHPVFIVIYAIYVTAAVSLAFMSRKPNEGRILKIIVGAFRDLRLVDWTETLSMVVSNFIWPLRRFGLYGFLVGLVYWPIAIPLTLVVAVIYLLPTVYLTLRMIFYSKSAIFERARKRKKSKPYQVNVTTDQDMHKFEADTLLEKSIIRRRLPSESDNNSDLGLDDIDAVAPREHFKNLKDNISLASSILKYQATNYKRFTMYVLSAILCILTLYALVIIMTEVLGCFIEIMVFTIMGIIVNAAALLKYVMLIVMILIYSADCFNNVEKKYIKLNKALFNEVKGRVKDLSDVTSLPSFLQENRGFKCQELSEQADYESPDDVVDKPLNHWMINDLCLFIDSEDMPRIPKQLFDEVCEIRVAGVPGPVYRGLIEAFEHFLKAVVFLLFVFIIILTFSSVYKISSTGQVLATSLMGFVPLLLRNILTPPTPDVEIGTVSFKSKMDEVIKNFCQYWPIYDFPFHVLTEEDLKKMEEDKKKKEEEEAAKKEKKEGGGEEERKETDNAEDNAPVPAYAQPTYMDYVVTMVRMEGEVGLAGHEMSSFNNNDTSYNVPSSPTSPVPPTPYVEKFVRLTEPLQENEVDILIYLPDKYDDVWLDEWSDIASRTSRTHVNSAV